MFLRQSPAASAGYGTQRETFRTPPPPAPQHTKQDQFSSSDTHLLLDLLLDLLEAGPQVHVDCVFGAQQGLQHGVSRHAHLLQGRLLHSSQVHHLDLQVLNLGERHGGDGAVRGGALEKDVLVVAVMMLVGVGIVLVGVMMVLVGVMMV